MLKPMPTSEVGGSRGHPPSTSRRHLGNRRPRRHLGGGRAIRAASRYSTWCHQADGVAPPQRLRPTPVANLKVGGVSASALQQPWPISSSYRHTCTAKGRWAECKVKR